MHFITQLRIGCIVWWKCISISQLHIGCIVCNAFPLLSCVCHCVVEVQTVGGGVHPSLYCDRRPDDVHRVPPRFWHHPTDSPLRGGIAARQLCLWVQLQRELHRRGMLRQENVQRLEAIGFQWHPSQAPSEVRTWLSQLGRLLLLIERGRSSALVGGEHALLRGPLGVPPEMAARGLGRRYRLQVALEQEVRVCVCVTMCVYA